MINNYSICPICQSAYAEAEHHLIFGTALRRLADQDGLTIKTCNNCHTMASRVTNRIHDNMAAEALSKMLGQALYENQQLAAGASQEAAREKFIERYGMSYL